MSPKNKSVQPKKSVLSSKSNLSLNLKSADTDWLMFSANQKAQSAFLAIFDVNLNQDKTISKTWLYDVSIIAVQVGYE